jgi:hypothetical protein
LLFKVELLLEGATDGSELENKVVGDGVSVRLGDVVENTMGVIDNGTCVGIFKGFKTEIVGVGSRFPSVGRKDGIHVG